MPRLKSTLVRTALATGSFIVSAAHAQAIEVDVRHVAAGVAAAYQRALLHLDGFEFAGQQFSETTEFLVSVFQQEEEEWSVRAIQLASEVIAVGVISRNHYGEPELSIEDVRYTFLPYLREIGDSWVHD